VELQDAVAQFQQTLALDGENVAAHYNLGLIFTQLGDAKRAEEHQTLHARYKPDDNARDLAVAAARKKYPAADFAAEALVIYPLQRDGAPGLAAMQTGTAADVAQLPVSSEAPKGAVE
jgi:lipopolysaccharide biosynthesis regulator YciM